MAYELIVTDKKAYEWLKKLINNTSESSESRPYQDYYEELFHWKEAFEQCDKKREEEAAARKAARQSKAASARKKTSNRSKKEPSPFDCLQHTSYGGVRVPRTDCKQCWSIYKKLHPMEYAQARRKFALKNKKQ